MSNISSECRSTNISSVAECNGHGKCALHVNGSLYCDCSILFSSYDNCAASFFETYRKSDLFYPIIFIILYIVVGTLIALEIIIDFRREKKRFIRVIVYTKVVMLAYAILRLTHFGIWMNRTLNGYESAGVNSIEDGVVSGLAIFCSSLGYGLVVILWTTLVDKVEKLRESMSRSMKRLRKGLIISTGVICPIIGLLFALQAIGIGGSLMNTAFNIVVALWVLMLAIVTVIYNLRVLKLLQRSQSFSAKKFRRKAAFIICGDVVTVLLVIVLLVYPFTQFRNLPWHYLGYQAIVRLLEFILFVDFYGTIELYCFDYGFLKGFRMTFQKDLNFELTRKTSNRRSSTPSSETPQKSKASVKASKDSPERDTVTTGTMPSIAEAAPPPNTLAEEPTVSALSTNDAASETTSRDTGSRTRNAGSSDVSET